MHTCACISEVTMTKAWVVDPGVLSWLKKTLYFFGPIIIQLNSTYCDWIISLAPVLYIMGFQWSTVYWSDSCLDSGLIFLGSYLRYWRDIAALFISLYLQSRLCWPIISSNFCPQYSGSLSLWILYDFLCLVSLVFGLF